MSGAGPEWTWWGGSVPLKLSSLEGCLVGEALRLWLCRPHPLRENSQKAYRPPWLGPLAPGGRAAFCFGINGESYQVAPKRMVWSHHCF